MIGPDGIQDDEHDVGLRQFRRPQVFGKGGQLRPIGAGRSFCLPVRHEMDHRRLQQSRSGDGRANLEEVPTTELLGLLTHCSSPVRYDEPA